MERNVNKLVKLVTDLENITEDISLLVDEMVEAINTERTEGKKLREVKKRATEVKGNLTSLKLIIKKIEQQCDEILRT